MIHFQNQHSRLTRNKLGTITLAVLVALSLSFTLKAGNFPQRIIDGQLQPSLAPIIKESAPAVVNIATYTLQRQYNPLFQSPFFRHFFDLPEEIEESRNVQSAGSGVIVDAEKGYILTNHHVIADSDDIEVKLQDGRQFKAHLIGSDKKVDIALLRIKADKLSAIQMANSNSLAVGDFVIAIGNPFGIGQTVTSGIVSALGRNGLGIQGYEDFIQTDASINPGNSGGALLDLNGHLVGINSAIIAPAGGNVGIGFAIPTEVSQSVMSQLIQFGEVKRGGIGARFQDLSPELAEAFSVGKDQHTTYQGAVVSSVEENSAAKRAGLRAGDIITRANGREIKNANDIQNRIGLSAMGHILNIEIIRGGTTKVIDVEIQPIPVPEIYGDKLSPYLSGALLMDLIPSDQEAAVGVQIKELARSSLAKRAGFEQGDIIFAVNRTRIRNIAELKSYLRQRKVQAFRVRRAYEDLILYVR